MVQSTKLNRLFDKKHVIKHILSTILTYIIQEIIAVVEVGKQVRVFHSAPRTISRIKSLGGIALFSTVQSVYNPFEMHNIHHALKFT